MQSVEFTKRVREVLAPAMRGGRKTVTKEVMQGISQVYRAHSAPLYLITRLEGAEFVVVAAAGKNLAAATQEIIRFARSQGASTIRFHTRHPERLRKGLQGVPVRLAYIKKHVFGPDEQVYRLEI